MPEDGYGWEKLFSERMCRHFYEDYKLETRVARYHNVYGPQGTWHGGREKAPAALCRKVIEAISNNSHAIEIWGDGEQTRSFMFIDDAVENILRCINGTGLTGYKKKYVWSDEYFSVRELVERIQNAIGEKIECAWGARDYVGHEMMEPWAIPMEQLPGFVAPTSLETGIKKIWKST
jgi:nucleoside-diphosphate-sugar epimerase